MQSPIQPSKLTTAESLQDLLAEATAFALLFRLLSLWLLLNARLRLRATCLPRKVLVAHALLAGKVWCASRELRRCATSLRRLKLRCSFPSRTEIL